MLLVARLVDGVDTPIWGILFDRTHSRWGRSRPWFLWLCGPFAIFGVLTFAVPHWTAGAKLAYACVTYVACGVLYTGINTPVTSILSALTSDPHERVTLTCFRMVGSKAGALLVNLTALALVGWLGHGNDHRGYALTLPLFAAGSVILFLLAFRNLKETVPTTTRRGSPLRGFGALRGNWPWLTVFLSFFAFWIAFIARITMVPFYFQYALHRPDLIPAANAFDFASLAAVFALPRLCRWTSKRNVCLGGLLGCVAGQLLLAAGAGAHPRLGEIAAGWVLGFVATGAAMALPFSMLSDCVDYGEWRTGIRAEGLLTAIGAAFCIKAGSGLGGALPAWIMAAHGYVANAVQTPRSLEGIALGFIWLPAAGYGLAMLPLAFYGPYERLEPRIQAELRDRRKAAGSA